jgi:putative FmdB family regulatory protein
MPLYEYHCKPCDLIFEVLMRSTGDHAYCPRCDSIDVNKLLSVPATAQTAAARISESVQSKGNGDSAPFGCSRPQCGTGMCAGLD